MTKQVFISYSSNDLHTAERICTLLEAEGIGCWIAPRDVLPGTIYAEEIIKAIESTDGFVLICSRFTSDSVHVRSEVEHAFSHRKIIFPVRMEDVELGKALEYFLGSSHWLVAWNAPLEECVARLVESMRNVIGREEIPGGGGPGRPPDVPTSTAVDPAQDQHAEMESAAGRGTERSQTHPDNLPAQTTRLIGREKEVAEVVQLLKREDVRMVTLAGPGGTGKTRLGLQVAAELIGEFDDGVFFVPLAPIKDSGLVASAIAQALGVQDVGGQPILDCLARFLKDKQILLLLDNFEQIISAAPVVAGLLAECPILNVLVTSREMLHLSGEYHYVVPALTLPEIPQNRAVWSASVVDIAQFESVQLFVERALAIMPDFETTNENAPAIAEICHRLDGLPLAIELAVARIRLLPPPKLLERLDKRLPLLARGAKDRPARQRTLEGAIAWSYDLLDEAEKMLFRRLSVFTGGFTLEAVEDVFNVVNELLCDVLDGTTSLEEKSLLKREESGGELRFTMLETVREYAEERLEESGEAGSVRKRHAEYCYSLALAAEPKLGGAERIRWLSRLDSEHNNFRSALAWSVAAVEKELALEMAAKMSTFWHARGHFREGRYWLEEAMNAEGDASASAQTNGLSAAGSFECFLGDKARGMQLLELSLSLAREIKDAFGVVRALLSIGAWSYWNGDDERAVACLEECVAVSEESGYYRQSR